MCPNGPEQGIFFSMAYWRNKRYAVGRGLDPRDKELIGVDFDPWTPKTPTTIWAGENFGSRTGATLRVSDLDRYLWAFDCTNTRLYYSLLKHLPPGQPPTYELVNAEYVKHHGNNMELSLD